MNITAIDIHQKEFAHGMRGYREDEVDAFLDQLAVEVDAADKRIRELEEKIASLELSGANFEAERNTINNTLLTAQKAADEMLTKAQNECAETLAASQRQAETQLAEAKRQSDRIMSEAQQKRHQLIGNFARLQGEEEKFRKNYLGLLDAFLFEARQLEAEARTMIQEVPVPKHLKEELQEARRGTGEQPIVVPAPLSKRAVSVSQAPTSARVAQSAPAPAPAPPQPVPEPAPAPAASAAVTPAPAPASAPAPAPKRAKKHSKDPLADALADSEFFEEAAPPAFQGVVDEPTMKQAPVAADTPVSAASLADQWGDMDNDLDSEMFD